MAYLFVRLAHFLPSVAADQSAYLPTDTHSTCCIDDTGTQIYYCCHLQKQNDHCFAPQSTECTKSNKTDNTA